jgi:hypothetical protein
MPCERTKITSFFMTAMKHKRSLNSDISKMIHELRSDPSMNVSAVVTHLISKRTMYGKAVEMQPSGKYAESAEIASCHVRYGKPNSPMHANVYLTERQLKAMISAEKESGFGLALLWNGRCDKKTRSPGIGIVFPSVNAYLIFVAIAPDEIISGRVEFIDQNVTNERGYATCSFLSDGSIRIFVQNDLMPTFKKKLAASFKDKADQISLAMSI